MVSLKFVYGSSACVPPGNIEDLCSGRSGWSGHLLQRTGQMQKEKVNKWLAEEIALSVKCLLFKHEDLSLIPEPMLEKSGSDNVC